MQRVHPWSRLWSTAALFLIGGGVGLVMLGALAVRASDTPDRPVPVGTPFPGPTTAPLLPDEAAHGTQILVADPLFQKLVAGRQYKIEYVVPWYGADRKRVGVAIEVSLDQLVAGTFEWRDVRYDLRRLPVARMRSRRWCLTLRISPASMSGLTSKNAR